jgi:hypothetical protein
VPENFRKIKIEKRFWKNADALTEEGIKKIRVVDPISGGRVGLAPSSFAFPMVVTRFVTVAA